MKKPYANCWTKMLNKLQAHATAPVAQWNTYHLLGYVLAQTVQTIDAKATPQELCQGYGLDTIQEPARHPMVESMRKTLDHFGKDPEATKGFLDWSLRKYGTDLSIKALRSLWAQYENQQVRRGVRADIPDRSDLLPSNLAALFEFVSTYGELAFLLQIKREEVIAKLATVGATIESLKLEKIV